MKKVLLFVGFLLILIAIPATVFLVKQQQDIRQRAAPASRLYFDPSTVTKNAGDTNTFSFNIMIETGENLATAVELHIDYDQTFLEAVSIQKGPFFDTVLTSGNVNTPGKASITLGSAVPKQATTAQILAVLTMKVKNQTTATPTQIVFDRETTQDPEITQGRATNEGVGQDIIVATQPALVTITSAGGTTTTTTTPSPSLSPSPSASPGGGTGGTGTGTASPSPSPSTSLGTSPSASPVTKITSLTSGVTLTTRRPTFSGVSFPNALIIVTINSPQTISANLTANASGNWSYTPTVDLVDGPHTITVTGDNNAGKTEIATANFTISITGAGSPSTSTKSAIPVSGTSLPTFFLLLGSLTLISFGIISFKRN